MTLETEPATARGDAPSPTGRRTLVRRVLQTGWLAVLVVALGLALRSRWTEISEQLVLLDARLLLLSAAVGFAGLGLSSGIWHAMLHGIGEPLPARTSLRIFFVGQIGKYLPGAVWPAVTQAALARDHGIAPRATITAATLFLWVHLVTGAAIGIAALVSVGGLPAVTLAALPVLLALLAPGVLRPTLQWLLRVVRREPLRRLPDGRHVLIACTWAVLMWLCYGAHVQLLTAAVAEPVGPLRALGVFAASWVVGFVLLIAPAGVGPREAAMVALLPYPAAAGLIVALASRLILTGADAGWAAVTAVDPGHFRGSRRRAASRPPAQPDGNPRRQPPTTTPAGDLDRHDRSIS